MKTNLLVCIIFFVSIRLMPQTLITSYDFPRLNSYNYFWGITEVNDTFWVGSDYNSTGGTYLYSWTYKVTKQGVIVDSFQTPIQSNHGLEWYDNHFWLAEGYRAQGSRIFKMNTSGVFVDTFVVPGVIGGLPIGIGDLALDGDKMWFSIYSPDFTTYPKGYAYAFDLNTRQLVDTIPLMGRQVLGIAVKGDTIFYVNENQYTNETERIYAYSKSGGDTLFSFPAPDPDGNCNPKSLYWDGSNLWLVAERVGPSQWIYKTLYKYEISGGGNPIIMTSASKIDFGNAIIGMPSVRGLNIQNAGTADLVISDFVFEGSGSFSTAAQFPDTIKPGVNKNYDLLFTPAVFDSAYCSLKIYSNDGASPVKTVLLKGKGVESGSYIYTTGTTYNFLQRRVNSMSGYEFLIENRGTEPLVINSITTSSGSFFRDSGIVALPITIDTLRGKEFRIWFTPAAASVYIDTVIISSNSVNNPLLKFALSGEGRDEQTATGDIFWQSHIPYNPFAYINDYKPMSVKVIGDVNGDGVDDILAASRNYLVTCYNGNSSVEGDILWTFNSGYNNNNTGSVMFEESMQVREDVNADGIMDVVIGCGGGNEFVYTVSGRNGSIIWAYGDSIDYARGDINGLRADADFNADGVNDVLVSASGSSNGGRHASICLNGITGEEIFNLVQPASYTFNITSLENGGAIGVDLGNGGPYMVNAFSKSGLAAWSIGVSYQPMSLKEVNDINGDGKKDIVGFSGPLDVKTYVLDADNGMQIWQKSFLNFSTFSTIEVISDVNGNGFSDFVFSGKEGVYRLDTYDGAAVWYNPLDNSYTFDVNEVGDINADGTNDIAAGTMGCNFYLLDGKDGSVLYQTNFGSSADHAVERTVRVKSIDGNYTDDFVFALRDGRVFCGSGGPEEPVSVKDAPVVYGFSLEQNYPNPFNPSTMIKFSIPTDQYVSVKVYNLLGQEVALLMNKDLKSGEHEVTFNAAGLSSGMYFYKIEAGSYSVVRKMMLLK